jgi:hypothetical protein
MSDNDHVRFIPPELLPHHRIRYLWAALAIDPSDDSEGLIMWPASPAPGIAPIPQPLIGSDELRLESLRQILPKIARALGQPIKLVRFAVREDAETFEP